MAVGRHAVVLVLVAAVVRSQDAPGAAAGGVYTDELLSGMKTVWGHDDHAAGAEMVGGETLARVDVLQGIRDHTTSPGCRQALDELLRARSMLKLWALKMHWSSAALPDALLSGALSHLGDYDTCLSVPEAMYCLVEAEVRPAASAAVAHQGDEASPFDPPNGANATLWDLLKTSGNYRRYRRDNQQWALCLPAQCGGDPADPREAVRQLGSALAGAITGLARSLEVQLRVHIESTDCSARRTEDQQLWALLSRPLFLFGSAFILLFPVLTCTATLRDAIRNHITGALNNPNHGIVDTVLQCFAVRMNWQNLFRKQKSQIHSIQGLRVITIVGVIAGHRLIFPFGGPVFNPEYYEGPSKMVFVNGHGIVATFFVIMAFLEARLCMMEYRRTNRFRWTVLLAHYAYRYLRIVPAMAVMIAFDALWLEHLGSGPLWGRLVAAGEARLCKTIWWQNLLFVSNVLSPGTQCLVQTWFLAAAMQMYLATPLLMWAVFACTRRKGPWAGGAVLGPVLAAAMLALLVCTAVFGLLPTTPLFPSYLRNGNFVTDPTFVHQYVATHANLVPYAVGLATGTLFVLVNQRGWRPSQRARRALLAGIPVTAALQGAAVVAGVAYLRPAADPGPDPHSTWVPALYALLRALAFAVPTAWTVFACAMGCGGVVSRVLTWTPLLGLGRITYSVFLVHLSVVMASAASIRQPLYLSTATYIRSVIADVVLSYACGFLLYMFVEAPVSNVLKVLADRGLRTWEERKGRANTSVSAARLHTSNTESTGMSGMKNDIEISLSMENHV